MKPLDVLVLYNEPTLASDDRDWAQEAGVLESVEAVVEALTRGGHQARKLGIGVPGRELTDELAQIAPADVVFNLFEGLSGVGRGEAEVTGLVELLGYGVTGSPAECLSLVRDKARAKWLLAGAGVPTAEFVLVPADAEPPKRRLLELLAEGPLFIKPAHEDGSLGIGSDSIVTDFDSLTAKIEALRSRYGGVLVERFVVGREFNVAVLDIGGPRLLPLAEIAFSAPGPKGWQIVTYDAKWDVGGPADRATPARCPAHVDSETARRIGQVAMAAFQRTGCRDYARVDLRMDPQGRIFVLEVNGNPDIGPSAGFARSLRVGGWEYADFVNGLVEQAYQRSHARSASDVKPGV